MTRKPLTRRQEIDAQRHPKPVAATPEELAFYARMVTLTDTPEFGEFLAHFADKIERKTVEDANPNAGALFLIEGGRKLLREMKGLRERAERELRAADV